MFNGLGTSEMVLLGIVALLLFGSKLPEIARKFGATYRDLRGKVDDFQREFRDWDKEDAASSAPTKSYLQADEEEPKRSEPTTPKFVPPPDDDD
ncbi:MAG: twin-arginine translocase TatA/TatE family subunit [Aureliella sp.]